LTKKMANKISVLLSMSMTLMVDCQINQIRHVQEGDEYKIIQESRQEKSVQTLCNEIPKEKLQNCYREDGDDRSFHDFWSEDIEKMRNVSFNHPDYVGNVLLVVNLASF